MASETKAGRPPPFDEAVASGLPLASTPLSSSSSQFRSSFACMTRFSTDRLHLVDFPQAEIVALQELLQTAWPKGAQYSKAFGPGKGWDIKLVGVPWAALQCGDDGRVLLCKMLEHLYDRGWMLHTSFKVVQHDLYGDTLVFRHQVPAPPPCEWLVVAFERLDRLKIIGTVPANLAAALTSHLRLQTQKTKSNDDFLEIKLGGYPWAAVETEGIRTQMTLLAVLDALQLSGFALYGNIRMQQLTSQDLLVVHRQKDWAVGMPVWQR